MATLPMLAPPQRSAWLPATVPARSQRGGGPVRLSAVEWSVVALAERDSVASLREPSRFLSMLVSLFGVRRPTRVANDRLEALRRISVLAWRHRWNVPKSELNAFVEAGFSLDHYELVQASIGKARAKRRRASR